MLSVKCRLDQRDAIQLSKHVCNSIRKVACPNNNALNINEKSTIEDFFATECFADTM